MDFYIMRVLSVKNATNQQPKYWNDGNYKWRRKRDVRTLRERELSFAQF